MNISPLITCSKQPIAGLLAIKIKNAPVTAFQINVQTQTIPSPENTPTTTSYIRSEWTDEEYRQAYMEAAVEQGIAWQIRSNREQRGWTQAELAHNANIPRPTISQMEDPECETHSLDLLIKVANAFDCALSVRLIPYSRLAQESNDLSPRVLYAAPFSEELRK